VLLEFIWRDVSNSRVHALPVVKYADVVVNLGLRIIDVVKEK
jgi:hypothetical protein